MGSIIGMTLRSLFEGFINRITNLVQSVTDLMVDIGNVFVSFESLGTFLVGLIPAFLSSIIVLVLGIFIFNYLVGR